MFGIFKLGEDKKYFIKCALIGSLCITVAYALLVINPLQQIIDDQLSVHESSFLYNLFKRPPLDVFIAITVFNITNTEAFLNGSVAQLHVTEIGPFVYQEYLEHQNTTFNADGSISYVPVRTHKFIRDRSIGHPSDYRIKVPNIPLLGMSSQMNKWSIFGAMTLSSLAMSLKLEPILDMTVDELLWGYEDPLVKFGSKVIPSFISIEKFGLLDRMFDDGLDIVQMHLPNRTGVVTGNASADDAPLAEGEQHPGDYSILNWDKRQGLKQWHYNEDDPSSHENTACNTLRGTYDGTLFPKGFQRSFRVYRKAFCRTLQMKYWQADRIDGINVEWFRFDEKAFSNDARDPQSSCYCEDQRCLKQGLGDISPCYYNIPLAVSLPHYLRSDASFQDRIVGLHPNEDKHDSYFGLQPEFGVPMSVRIRVQLNLIVESTRFNQKIKPFDGTATPLLWVEISVDGLPVYLRLLYHVAFNLMPHVQTGIIYSLFIVGPLSIALGVTGLFTRKGRLRTSTVAAATTTGPGGGQVVLLMADQSKTTIDHHRSGVVRLVRGSSSSGSRSTSGTGRGAEGDRMTKGLRFVRYSPVNISFQSKVDV